MSDRAMEMAAELFKAYPNFRSAVRGAGDKGAYVNSVLRSHTPPTKQEKLAGAETEGLTAEEQRQVNAQPWHETDDQLIDRIGKAGCNYT